jgi:DNA-binding transcriptional ArsR family regulator
MSSANEKDADVIIVSLSDDRLKKVARALSNETAVTVLKTLVEKSMSATELSETLKLSLTTIEYNISTLLEAELIKVDRIKFSRKRRDIKYYAVVKRALVFAPEKTERGLTTFLKKVLPLLLVLALSFPAGLVVQHIVTLYGGPPHELPIDHAYIPFYVFIAGVIFAILTFAVIEWLRKVLRNTLARALKCRY